MKSESEMNSLEIFFAFLIFCAVGMWIASLILLLQARKLVKTLKLEYEECEKHYNNSSIVR